MSTSTASYDDNKTRVDWVPYGRRRCWRPIAGNYAVNPSFPFQNLPLAERTLVASPCNFSSNTKIVNGITMFTFIDTCYNNTEAWRTRTLTWVVKQHTSEG